MTYSSRVSPGTYLLFGGRILTGVCCPLLSAGGIVYISETVNHEKISFFVRGFQLAATVGTLLTFIIGKYLPWSWLAVECCIYPLLLLVLLTFLPESPTWLASKGRISEATEAQIRFHGDSGVLNAQEEIASVLDFNLQNSRDSICGVLRDLLKPTVWKPLLLSLVLLFFQNFSGFSAILFYAQSVFESTGSDLVSPSDATIIIGAVHVVFTFIACLVAHRARRRLLFLFSGLGNAVGLVALSTYFFLKTEKGDHFVQQQYLVFLPIVAVAVFVSCFNLGWAFNTSVFANIC